MLAMMLTVIIVTAGVLWMTGQRVETSYLRLSEERFRSQMEMFASLQNVQLGRHPPALPDAGGFCGRGGGAPTGIRRTARRYVAGSAGSAGKCHGL